MVIVSNSLKTLGLTKLRSIESGIVHLQTEQLCLFDTLNWEAIIGKKNQFSIKKENIAYAQQKCGK